jgi:oxygen-dependent protoporphyrinogen oxidase
LERDHGSVVGGFLASSSARSPGLSRPVRAPRLQTGGFARGNQTLIDALVARLGASAYSNARVVTLRQRGAGFVLECDGLPESKIEAARVILATSAEKAAELVKPLEPGAAEDLHAVESPPVAQVALAYPKASVGVPLDGFGFLVCRGESVRILGAVWNSVVLRARCPDSEVLITAFLGGATDSDIQECNDEEVARVAHRDLSNVMRISQRRPTVVAGFRWAKAIPQYTLGHEQRIARIRAAIDRVPNLYLAGNFMSGVSVSDCIRLAQAAAAKASSQP